MTFIAGDQVSDISECGHNDHDKFLGNCWHEVSTVGLVYRDGAVWLRNPTGYARRFRPDQVRRRR